MHLPRYEIILSSLELDYAMQKMNSVNNEKRHLKPKKHLYISSIYININMIDIRVPVIKIYISLNCFNVD